MAVYLYYNKGHSESIGYAIYNTTGLVPISYSGGLLWTPLHARISILQNLLNALVQIVNKMRLQKNFIITEHAE
jgi:hypothetical protein